MTDLEDYRAMMQAKNRDEDLALMMKEDMHEQFIEWACALARPVKTQEDRLARDYAREEVRCWMARERLT